jgi:uncharacterized protein YkwD
MPRRTILLTVLALLVGALGIAPAVATAGPAPRQAARTADHTSAAEYCLEPEEQAFLKLINDYRAQNGRSALVAVKTLGAAAEHHSVDMAAKNYFSHTLADGTTWSQNIVNHGYTYNTYRGENIAAGNSLASSTFNQWKNSSGHNANMLSTNFKAIGIGRAYGANSTYKWYWTADFGGYADAAAAACGGTTSASPTPTPTTSTSTSSGAAYTIAGSGRTSNSNSSAYAYDAKTSTSWYTTTSSPPSVAYVWFDLGAKKSIGSVQWVFAQTGYADRLVIQVSNDRSTWTTLKTVGNAPAGAWQTLSASTSARYVRFYFQNPNKDARLGYLAEVKITA